MTIPEQVPFWRRMPPAVFPPMMGLFGLALAWRRAVDGFGIPPAIADLILGATTLLFLFLFAAQMAKYLLRPEAMVEDLRVLPGRTGLAASSLSVLLLAAALVPFSERLAAFLLTAGLIWHLLLLGVLVYVLLTSPVEQRKATPAWHLTFVGFIVAPLSAVPLGMIALSSALLIGTFVIAAVIYAVSLAQLAQREPPPPLRPLLAIHLAPLCLFGTVSVSMGLTSTGLAFAILGTVMLAALLIRARYLTASGFSPLWGAFTFPLAAYAGLMISLSGSGALFRIIGGLALVAATLMIPAITVRVLRMWAKGTLSKVTNAAVA